MKMKRLFSLLLALVMMLSLLPVSAMAEGDRGIWEVGDVTPIDLPEPLPEDPEEPEEEIDPNCPEQGFVYFDDETGLEVEVEAPEGALPLGVDLAVTPVLADDYQAQVDELLGSRRSILVAMDISFVDEETGEEFHPNLPVTVKVFSPELAGRSDLTVVHIPDADDEENEPEVILQLPKTTLGVEFGANGVAFDAEDFSVYAVIGEEEPVANNRATVNFISKGTTIATVYVKNSDTAEDLEQIVYDPGVGTLASGEMFLGWTTEQNYTAETTPMTIDDVRTYLEGLSITGDNTVVNFYAIVSKVIKITYLDEKGVALGATNANLIGSQTEADVTVDMAYTPPENTQNFEGWIVTVGKTNITKAVYEEAEVENGGTETNPYKNGTVLTITGDVTVSVSAPQGHWLVFDENGKGGTYNAPQFVKGGTVTKRPRPDSEMQRYGYTFGGWYTDKECTSEFTFGGQLTDNTTIYAKWIPAATANYTILIWKQNVHDAKNAADSAKTYDFAEAINGTGTVGATINPGNATTKNYPGFHLNKYDQNVTIVTEGTSIVNVYYDRNLVTLTFRHWESGWFGGGSWVTDQTMTGLYGSTLASNGYTWPSDYRWTYSSNGSTVVMTFLDAFIPPEGGTSMTFNRDSLSGDYHIYFGKQDPEDETSYTLANTVNADGNSNFYITDKYNGYKAVAYGRSANGPWTALGAKDSNGRYATVDIDYADLYILYDPLQYNILYMDGVYVDGNGNPVAGYESRGQLNEVDDINYDSSLTSYNKDGDDYYAPTYDGFVFEGWYSDETCTHAYTFTTMPEGITVYAKWRQVQYRVFLHPNAGTDSTLDWGSDDQAMNFRISNGSKVSVPTGLRSEYEMIGWYLDEACTNAFSADAFVLNDNTVPESPTYDKTKDFTDPMDKWGNGATTNADTERFWITRKLDLYAKWRAKLIGANGIGVIYDANGGTNAPSDTTLYLDQASAVAQAASTAPEGKQFDHWVVQTWNGTEYVDTATTVLPGALFEVLKANAKTEELEGSTPEQPRFSYTVQLRAEYVDKEEPTPTHIDWYSNVQNIAGIALDLDGFNHDVTDESVDGKGWVVTDKADGSLQINEAINIRPATTYSYPGYTFLGWSKDKDADGSDDSLFLKWDAENNQFLAKDSKGAWVAVTKVAADETEYDDLYAVWGGEFYIYHSGVEGGNIETVSLADVNGTYDLTQNITAGTLYGGYYLEEGFTVKMETGEDELPIPDADPVYPAYDGSNWTWSTPETVSGKAMVPVGGETYYIKEVPADKYLRTYFHYTYHKDTNFISNAWLMSDVDDLKYMETGFAIISDHKTAKVASTLNVTTKVGNTSVKLDSTKVFGAPGKMTYLSVVSGQQFQNFFGNDVMIVQYWKTFDGLYVTSTVGRTFTGMTNGAIDYTKIGAETVTDNETIVSQILDDISKYGA